MFVNDISITAEKVGTLFTNSGETSPKKVKSWLQM